MDANESSGRRRKGPPLAVSTRRATESRSSPRRHYQSAECSLSIGMMCAADSDARARTSSPAMTRTSLVAVATVAPASTAASVGRSAAAPVMATHTTSASIAAISQAASMPTAQPGGSEAPAAGFTSAIRLTPNCAATAPRATASRPPTMPTSSNRSGKREMTSQACLPIDPVAPRRTTRRRDVVWVTGAQMPRYGVDQSTLPLSPQLRERDQLQVAIYDWGKQNEAIGAIEQSAVSGDERSRVLDAGLTLERRLDE